ncbi:DUF1642 domain-containing protein [Streptococcus ruminantium]|uniref:DUF1642 domain-containing protein n=1 Tax=Streptococcus ruminantium TaxID=1917441 RepID=UPI001F1C40B0|nr:DUF1642 domain-containing protein [Streptococcus ruminantium]BDD37919.1 hypothetical protein GUT183_01570 [Streptococcus ruminantium]
MNKQEAIKCIEQMGEYEHFVDEPISKKSVLNIISQIDESQKVMVPRKVAEWLEECKTKKRSLWCALEGDSNEVNDWLDETGNEELFALAWIYGYEIEPDPLYTVEIPDPNNHGSKAVLGRVEGKVCIKQITSETWYMNCSNQLTESEIRKDFEWAWKWAEPVEVAK